MGEQRRRPRGAGEVRGCPESGGAELAGGPPQRARLVRGPGRGGAAGRHRPSGAEGGGAGRRGPGGPVRDLPGAGGAPPAAASGLRSGKDTRAFKELDLTFYRYGARAAERRNGIEDTWKTATSDTASEIPKQKTDLYMSISQKGCYKQ